MIENGVANVNYVKNPGLRVRILKILMGYEVYLKTGDPSGSSVMQRIEYSKGSLSLWLGNFPYMPSEKTLRKRRIASMNAGRVLHQRKLERIAKIKREAKKEIPNIKHDVLKLLGVVAYWTEGSKTHDNLVAFTNTDAKFIKFVLKWL